MKKRANGSGTMYRRNGWWYAQMTIKGKVMRKALGTRDRAEAAVRLNKLASGFDMGDEARLAAVEVRLRPRTGMMTFDEAWARYCGHPANAMQTAGAQETDAGRWRFFMRWLHGYDGGPRCRVNCPAAHPECDTLADVTEGMASEFVRMARGKVSPETLNKYIRVVRRVWELNDATPNPWRGFKPARKDPTLRRALTDDELAKVIDAAQGEMRTLFMIGAYTGLRMRDCATLRGEDVQGDGIFRVTHKTHRPVPIPVHPKLRAVLPDRLRGYLLPKLARMPEWELSAKVQAHFKRCGLEEYERRDGYARRVATIGFHSLRITFITRMARAGVPLAVVRAMVGHVSEEMTLHYFRADEGMAREAIAKLA